MSFFVSSLHQSRIKEIKDLMELRKAMQLLRVRTNQSMGLHGESYEVDTGVCVWVKDNPMVKKAYGFGMDDGNDHNLHTDELLVQDILDWFKARGLTPNIEVSQTARLTFHQACIKKGLTLIDTGNVLVWETSNPIPVKKEVKGLELKPFSTSQADAPAIMEMVMRAYGLQPTETLMLAYRDWFDIPGQRSRITYMDGKPVGVATSLTIGKQVYLSGSAVLPGYRGLGIHQYCLWDRLNAAQQANNDLVMMLASPTAISEYNVIKAGFRITDTWLNWGL